MKFFIRTTTILLLFFQAFSVAAAQTNVAMEVFDTGEMATGRPMKINIWFPKGICANHANKNFCLADSAITDKAIIFSHGAMGSAGEYSWIGESLAAQGYVVVGVNHFGESWVYGQDSINPRSSGFIWQRAQDISALLDYLVQQNIFQNPISWSNIIAVGHSAGGQTASMLAGATFELKQMTDYCRLQESNNDRSCNYAKNSEKAPAHYQTLFSASQADARIKMIVLLDPALGPGAKRESLHAIKIPSLVIGAANNDFLPWRNHGQRYADETPNSKTRLLTGQEGHFVFLSPCDNKIKVMDVSLCEDRAGVDRKVTQEELAQNILEFIRTNNEAFAVQTSASIPAKQYSNSSDILEIIRYTPNWVFGLLLVLIVFGLLQTRTRQVLIQASLILPLVMLFLSFTGVLRYVGLQLPALFCWLLGVAVVTAMSIKLIGKDVARFDANTRKLIIKGSWVPLFVILGIFITRYALGVATAMDLNIIHHPYFPILASLSLGAWSGFFVAHGIIFWQTRKVLI
jgi:predicted dienelactone hydrolase